MLSGVESIIAYKPCIFGLACDDDRAWRAVEMLFTFAWRARVQGSIDRTNRTQTHRNISEIVEWTLHAIS